MRRLSVFPCLALLLYVQSTGAQSPSAVPSQIPGHDAVLLGTAWYPEQWPESRWEEDLRLMEAANIKVVRMAEFSWSLQKGTTTWIGSIGQSPRFAGKMGLDLMMLSITLVPVHDGREALAEYGRVWKIDASGWRLLSGPPAEIQKFCARF